MSAIVIYVYWFIFETHVKIIGKILSFIVAGDKKIFFFSSLCFVRLFFFFGHSNQNIIIIIFEFWRKKIDKGGREENFSNFWYEIDNKILQRRGNIQKNISNVILNYSS